jgi:hypothetical protein
VLHCFKCDCTKVGYMKTSGFFGKIAKILLSINVCLRGIGSSWKRNNKSMMRETCPNGQRGCLHTVNDQPKGRKYAKGAGGSCGRGINAKFDKSAFCQQKRMAASRI